jgi:hypothetical protein
VGLTQFNFFQYFFFPADVAFFFFPQPFSKFPSDMVSALALELLLPG